MGCFMCVYNVQLCTHMGVYLSAMKVQELTYGTCTHTIRISGIVRVLLTLARMRSKGYGTWFVCVCVCVSVRSISATMSKSKPRKRYQRFIATRQRE